MLATITPPRPSQPFEHCFRSFSKCSISDHAISRSMGKTISSMKTLFFSNFACFFSQRCEPIFRTNKNIIILDDVRKNSWQYLRFCSFSQGIYENKCFVSVGQQPSIIRIFVLRFTRSVNLQCSSMKEIELSTDIT